MKGEVSYDRKTGKFYVIFDSVALVEKFTKEVENMAKSKAFNRRWEEAKDLIDFLLNLKNAHARATEDPSTGYSEDEIDFKEEPHDV